MLLYFSISSLSRGGCKMKIGTTEYIDKLKVDDYITAALANLGYSDVDIKDITLEVDRLLVEVPSRQVAQKALETNMRVFSEMYI